MLFPFIYVLKKHQRYIFLNLFCPIIRLHVKKHQRYNLFHIIFTNFPIVPMATKPIFRSFL